MLDLNDGSSKAALFAVLDGHGGAEVARFVANHLVRRALGGPQRAVQGGGRPPPDARCRRTPPPCPLPRRPAAPACLQAQEVVSTEGYRANDMERALKEAYLRMDELLVKARRCRGAWAAALGCCAALLCWAALQCCLAAPVLLHHSPMLRFCACCRLGERRQACRHHRCAAQLRRSPLPACPPPRPPQEEHRDELKSLRGKEAEEEADRCGAGMGAARPSLLLRRCCSAAVAAPAVAADHQPLPSCLPVLPPLLQRPHGDQRRLAARVAASRRSNLPKPAL